MIEFTGQELAVLEQLLARVYHAVQIGRVTTTVVVRNKRSDKASIYDSLFRKVLNEGIERASRRSCGSHQNSGNVSEERPERNV